MKYILLTLALLFPAWSHAETSTTNLVAIHPFISGTNTLYAINGRPLDRSKAIQKIKRIANFTTDCRVIIATTGSISLRELHHFVNEVKAFGFAEVYALLIHEDQSFSIVNFTPSNDPNIWRPSQCVCGECTKKESQHKSGP